MFSKDLEKRIRIELMGKDFQPVIVLPDEIVARRISDMDFFYLFLFAPDGKFVMISMGEECLFYGDSDIWELEKVGPYGVLKNALDNRAVKGIEENFCQEILYKLRTEIGDDAVGIWRGESHYLTDLNFSVN